MQTNEQLLSAIENYLAQTEFPAEPELLYAPIGYSLAGGGKRLRPMLLMLSNGIFTDKIQHALPAAAAVEVFHNFTLLQDEQSVHGMVNKIRSLSQSYGRTLRNLGLHRALHRYRCEGLD